MHVFDAISARRSTRAFFDRDILRATVEELLLRAARAPPGGNLQPWKVHVLERPAIARISQAILAARAAGPLVPDYPYYPAAWREPWLARKRKVGWDLYAPAGIPRGYRAAAEAFHARNFSFFGAPVGLLPTLDADAGEGAWINLGIFAAILMLAAQAHSLATCPKAFFAEVAAPVNTLATDRAPLAEFARLHA